MMLMYSIMALSLVHVAFSNGLTSTACYANNCARAVTGTRPGKVPDVTSRRLDCSSFMVTTVTPPVYTTIITETVTTTTTLPVLAKRDGLAARQVTTSAIAVPTYASACSGAAAYSSACSCWGITATTITAPTPTITTITYTTVTATVCPTGDTQCGADCYDLSTSNDNCGSCGNQCASGTTCQSGSCSAPAGTCSNPTVCTGNDSCGTGDCYCHPDSNGVGYCHPASQCTFPTCTYNADCGDGYVCVDNCCGKVCRAIVPMCDNPLIKSRIFMKRGLAWTEPMDN